MPAYNNNSQGFRNGNQRGSYNDRVQPRTDAEYTPKAMPLPADYVEKAEEIMRVCHKYITSSKLRNILSMVSSIYNSERNGGEELTSMSQKRLSMLRIRIIYEYGRNEKKDKDNGGKNAEDVPRFIRETHILDYLLDIGSDREKFMDYAHYTEAIVAYHKFYGGK